MPTTARTYQCTFQPLDRDARGGNRISEEERAAMTPEEIGAHSAPYLFNALQQILKQSGAPA